VLNVVQVGGLMMPLYDTVVSCGLIVTRLALGIPKFLLGNDVVKND
jgi:hypothetical protein